MSLKQKSNKGKNIAIIVLSVLLNLSIGYIFYLLLPTAPPPVPDDSDIFLVGIPEGPSDLDPINSWDSASNNVIEQVCEGLFMYNVSDPDLDIIPCLAADYGTWDESAKRYTVTLRQRVYFHDYTRFNANAVKWNFERLNWFINATGELNTNLAQCHALWKLPNGSLILDPVNPVTINSDYSITINLKHPCSLLEDLLCYVSAYMISPNYHSNSSYIPLFGELMGTGPYKYDYHVAKVEVRFSRWCQYWRDQAFFDEVVFVLLSDSTTRNNAMLGHEMDYITGILPSLFEMYEADPCITLKHFTDDTSKPGLSYYYLGMNTEFINQTMRKAISYAINYTYLIEVVGNNLVVRANSPISPGYGAAYNNSVQAATFDIIKARQVLIDAGISSLDVNDDVGWRAAEYAIYNYTYNSDSSIRAYIGVALTSWLNEIGITIVNDGLTWESYISRLFGDYDKLGIFWTDWCHNYLNPFNLLVELFNPLSKLNSCQVNDTTLNKWMIDILVETDENARNDIYQKIQCYLANVMYPHCFGYHPKITYVHGTDIQGIPYNAIDKFYIYPIYRV